jgi:hypothetical protein
MQIIEEAASHALRRIIRSAIEPISGPKIATITPLIANALPQRLAPSTEFDATLVAK